MKKREKPKATADVPAHTDEASETGSGKGPQDDNAGEVTERDGWGYVYTVGKTEVFVSSRPSRLFGIDAKAGPGFDPKAYLSVTDTFVEPPRGKHYVWCPWNEGRYPTPELFYAVNRALNWFIHYKKLQRVQVFCDGGTHRSVTVFGAFLLSYFERDAKDIVAARLPRGQTRGSADHCNPLEYIGGYLSVFPEDKLLFKAMGEDYLRRLDAHCEAIHERVTARYGKRKGL